MPDTIAPALRPARIARSATLRLGYVRLTDAAPILVAEARGFFQDHGLSVALMPMSAWAAVRDRVAFGHLDGAGMLSPMPLAAALGLGGVQHRMAVLSTLNRNGNTVTLGLDLMAEIKRAVPGSARHPVLPASALAEALRLRRARGGEAPAIAIVHPFSSHNYLLRHWLAGAGIDAERDLRLVAVPPPQVADRLADGAIEGFCAGEPWGSRAVDLRVGRIALTSADIWPNHPEKVFAMAPEAVEADRPRAIACVAALMQAGRWLDEPGHAAEAADLLCRTALPDVPPAVVELALSGRLRRDPDGLAEPRAGLVFHRDGATRPDPGHGRWWLSQMQRWGHLPPEALPAPDQEMRDHLPDRLWRQDIWRHAAAQLGEAAPATDLAPQAPL